MGAKFDNTYTAKKVFHSPSTQYSNQPPDAFSCSCRLQSIPREASEDKLGNVQATDAEVTAAPGHLQGRDSQGCGDSRRPDKVGRWHSREGSEGDFHCPLSMLAVGANFYCKHKPTLRYSTHPFYGGCYLFIRTKVVIAIAIIVSHHFYALL